MATLIMQPRLEPTSRIFASLIDRSFELSQALLVFPVSSRISYNTYVEIPSPQCRDLFKWCGNCGYRQKLLSKL